MGLSAEIRNLFDERGAESWCRDGVFSEAHWAMAPYRLLFLLKEPHKFYTSLVETSQWQPHPIGWDGWIEIARWAYAVLNTGLRAVPDFDDCRSHDTVQGVESWRICRHQMSVMNLKKEPGGSTAIMDQVEDWAGRQQDFLRKQLELINPQIVVFCGDRVKEIATKVFRLHQPERVERPYFAYDDRLWIDFCHFRYCAKVRAFYALVGIMRAALQDPEIATLLHSEKGI